MTLCLGVLAQDAAFPRIGLCFDKKVSNNAFGSESEHKVHLLSDQLVSMFADSPSRAKELALIYQDHLRKHPLTPRNAIGTLRRPLGILKRELAEGYVGSRLGLSYREVLSSGLTGQKVIDRIEKNPLRVQIIIAGFIGPFPVLCDNGSVGTLLEWATNRSLIGSGACKAEPALHARNQRRQTPLPEALYNVFEAKRRSEGPSVGPHTTIYVLSPPPKRSRKVGIHVVTPEGMNYLDDLYAQYGPNRPMIKIPKFPDGSFMEVTRPKTQ
jgi:hypothetical protein